MPDRKDKKRDAPISIRATPEEKKQLFANAAKAGLSLSAYMKKQALDVEPPRQSRRPSVEEKLLAKMLNELAKARQDLRNVDGDPDSSLHMKTAVQTLIETRAALLKAMGREP